MPEEIKWGESSEEIKKLLPSRTRELRVRFVSQPIKFNIMYKPIVCRPSAGSPASVLGKIGPKYAAFIIDRDDGKLKVFEFSILIFDKLEKWAIKTKRDPASINNAPDWLIGPDKQGSMAGFPWAKYYVDPSNITILSKSELAIVETKANIDMLKTMYREHTNEEIAQMLVLKNQQVTIDDDELSSITNLNDVINQLKNTPDSVPIFKTITATMIPDEGVRELDLDS